MRSFSLSSRSCLSLYAEESSHNTHARLLTHALVCRFAINNSQCRSPVSLPKHTTAARGFNSEVVKTSIFKESKFSSVQVVTMSDMGAADPRVPAIQSTIRVVPDFPKPGILFQDITTLLLDPKAFKDTIDLFVERYKSKNISVVAGIEARGFIFGPPIALAIGAKFVPLRKPKKLPGEVIRQEYDLEYGSDCIEMHVGAVEPGERALVVDDLIATGGTLRAAMELIERAGAEVVECACVIEIPALKGRERLNGKPLFVLVDAQE